MLDGAVKALSDAASTIAIAIKSTLPLLPVTGRAAITDECACFVFQLSVAPWFLARSSLHFSGPIDLPFDHADAASCERVRVDLSAYVKTLARGATLMSTKYADAVELGRRLLLEATNDSLLSIPLAGMGALLSPRFAALKHVSVGGVAAVPSESWRGQRAIASLTDIRNVVAHRYLFEVSRSPGDASIPSLPHLVCLPVNFHYASGRYNFPIGARAAWAGSTSATPPATARGQNSSPVYYCLYQCARDAFHAVLGGINTIGPEYKKHLPALP